MMPGEFKWGPRLVVANPPTYRQQLIESMARQLREDGAAGDERDAIRSLFFHGYAMNDIAMLVPEARALAFQDLVAAEMSKP